MNILRLSNSDNSLQILLNATKACGDKNKDMGIIFIGGKLI